MTGGHELSTTEDIVDGTIVATCSCGEWEDRDLESYDDAGLLHEQHVEEVERG